jgi:hypothetical protein
MLTFLVCIYFGWRRYSWLAPMTLGTIGGGIAAFISIVRFTKVLPFASNAQVAFVGVEAVAYALLGAFCGWGLGRLLTRWRISRVTPTRA